MVATLLSQTLAQDKKDQILDAIMATTTYVHSSLSIMAYARTIFGKQTADAAKEERKEEEKEALQKNGSSGSALRASARAYCLLEDAGEQVNAAEWKLVIVPQHYLRVDFDAEVQNVRNGM